MIEIDELDQESDALDETVDIEEPQKEAREYDVVLQVKPEKLHTIKTELINGQRCIVVPIGDDEQATINGIEDLL